MKLNKLLNRQLQKFLPVSATNEELAEFIEAVNASYNAYERDIELQNHAFGLSEEEYVDINRKLKEEIEVKRVSVSRLKKSLLTVSDTKESPGPENADDDLLDIVNYLDSEIEKRKQAEQIYTSLIKNLQNGVLLEDENNHITFANQLFCDMFNISVLPDKMDRNKTSGIIEKIAHFVKDSVAFAGNTDAILTARVKSTEKLIEFNDGRYFMREYIPIFLEGIYKGHLWKYHDISEKIASEQKLRDSEERFRLTLERLGDNVWEHDFITGNSYFSNTDYELLGYHGNEEMNYAKIWWSSIHPEDLSIVQTSDENYKSGKADHHSLEYRILHKNGLTKWILDKGVVTRQTDDGMPLKIIGTHTDITAIKEIQNALKESEQQFKSLSENIPGIIFSYSFEKNGHHGFRYLSPAVEKIFGITAGEFSNPEKFVHHEDISSLFETINSASKSKKPFTFEGRIVSPGKGLLWISAVSSFSFVREDGARIYTGLITDITQRKMMEEVLRIREEKYRNIATNMRLGLMEVDNNDVITLANQSFCEMSGFVLPELLGKKAALVFSGLEERDGLKNGNQQRIKDHSEAYEISLRNKKGEPKWWLISGAPHYNDKGELIGSIGIHLDITKQKKLEFELKEAKLQAEKSAQAKELFLANMSHEIRTPMNAIMGMGEQLMKTELSSRQSIFLSAINNSAEHLLVVINDILDISKIEAGKMQIEHINFNIHSVIKSAAEVMSLKAEEKGLELGISIDENISTSLEGDPHRFKQILLNLISNSIKFTETGSVRIACTLLERTDEAQNVMVTVTDTGIGMDDEYLDVLFTKFSQEDNSVARKYGGTGLGMSISKKLLELMDGTIKVTSKKGTGTCVSIMLPFITGTAGSKLEIVDAPVDTSRLKGCRILLVEDNEMNRLVANTVLEHYEVVITEAENGKIAIDLLAQQTFDLVLMDMQMPVMNGIEAAMHIRKNISSDLPIIALTANAIKGESERCIAAGMNGYVSKPFTEESLITAIGSLLGQEIKSEVQTAGIVAESELFNLDGLRKLSRGNDAFVKKMVNIFIKNGPDSVVEMKDAFSGNDIETVRAVAHRLKPSIDNLCIESMKTRIRELETFQGETATASLKALIDEADEIISSVVIEFRKQFAS